MQKWLQEITWNQFLYWFEYAKLEPFGEEREDLRAGIITSNIVNIIIQANSDSRKGRPKLTKPTDFMPLLKDSVSKASARTPLTSSEEWQRFKGMVKAVYGPSK